MLYITGTYSVRVECFERQDPDSFTCPITTTTTTQRTTTTTQRTTTEVQQQTTTTPIAAATTDSSDRTNLCMYSAHNFFHFNIEHFLSNLR